MPSWRFILRSSSRITGELQITLADPEGVIHANRVAIYFAVGVAGAVIGG